MTHVDWLPIPENGHFEPGFSFCERGEHLRVTDKHVCKKCNFDSTGPVEKMVQSKNFCTLERFKEPNFNMKVGVFR